jgi:hypothetical protein
MIEYMLNYKGKTKKFATAYLLAHAMSQQTTHHEFFLIKENAMKTLHPDVDTVVFYTVTAFCAVLMFAL